MIFFRYLLIAFAVLVSGSCSAKNGVANAYEGYSPKEAAFLRDSEYLLFGRSETIYPQGGHLMVKYALQIDQICYTLFFTLRQPSATPYYPRNFWTTGSGEGAVECDQQAFFDDVRFFDGDLIPFRPSKGADTGIDGNGKVYVNRRAQLFIDVTGQRQIPARWASRRVNIGFYNKNKSCAAYVERDKFGSYDIYLSFLRKQAATSPKDAVSSRAGRRKVLLELAQMKTFGQCIVRTVALARGLEGAAVVPDSFFEVKGPFGTPTRSAPGCSVDDGVEEPHSKLSEMECAVPARKAGVLSGWILWALDSTDPEMKVYRRADFRAWIRKWLPPGSSRLAAQIQLLDTVH